MADIEEVKRAAEEENADIKQASQGIEEMEIRDKAISKARTAFAIFMSEKKTDADFQREFKELEDKKGFLALASKKWTAMSKEEKQKYQDMSLREKQIVEKQNLRKKEKKEGNEENEPPEEEDLKTKAGLQLPISRVRTIFNSQFEKDLEGNILDKKKINKEALLMIVKATEMFISDITSTSQKFAKVNGRKTIHL